MAKKNLRPNTTVPNYCHICERSHTPIYGSDLACIYYELSDKPPCENCGLPFTTRRPREVA